MDKSIYTRNLTPNIFLTASKITQKIYKYIYSYFKNLYFYSIKLIITLEILRLKFATFLDLIKTKNDKTKKIYYN